MQPRFPEHLGKGVRGKLSVPIGIRWDRRRPPACVRTAWRFLTVARRFPEAVVVAAIRGEVLRDGPQASAWFAHRDHEGRLTGFEMRGPDYRGSSAGGDTTLFGGMGRRRSEPSTCP